MRHIQLDITKSTNQDAKNLAAEADFGPLWVTAKQQTIGRGRNGREWISPAGNFYGSCLFPSGLKAQCIGLYSFAAALAVVETLSDLCPDGEFGLKWPNDILLGGAKVSGILLEAGQTHDQAWVIAGIGINLASHPKDLPYAAAHLEQVSNMPTDFEALLKILDQRFGAWRTVLEEKRFSAIRDAWLARAVNFPGKVNVRLPNESFEGQAVDLGLDGALHVRLANGTIRRVHAGDVFPG